MRQWKKSKQNTFFYKVSLAFYFVNLPATSKHFQKSHLTWGIQEPSGQRWYLYELLQEQWLKTTVAKTWPDPSQASTKHTEIIYI